MSTHRLFKLLRISLVTASLSMTATGMAVAADSAAQGQGSGGPSLTPEQRQLMTEFQQTRQNLRKVQGKLVTIEKKAYKKNPQLGKQRSALRDRIKKEMSSKGYDAQAKYDELKAMISKIKSESKGDAQRSKDIQAFRKAQQEFVQRQQHAMQNPEVQKMAKDLRKNVRSEMVKIDPKAKDLLAELNKNEQKMSELRQRAMKMHGNAQAPAKK